MKVLFIGGTGNISTAVSKLALQQGIDLYHLNRGNKPAIHGVKNILADIADSIAVKKMLNNHTWDVVVNWVAFTPEDVIRDIKYFEGKTGQYIFISSASVYQKPPVHYIIRETTPLDNPFWDYAKNKIACENLLMDEFAKNKFPVTIVRPSHTYDTVIPVTLGGWTEYTVVDRIKKGLPVVVQGDGTSLWTLTHADDFGIGLLGLFGNSLAVGEAFHITSDEVLTWNQIYQSVAQAVGFAANIIHIPSDYIADYADLHHYPSKRGSLLGDKSYSTVFDNSKIKEFVPTYKASIPFAVGIKNTLRWFESEPTRMVINENTNKFLDGLIDNFGK
jgi:nucleoside-diphosphate-sugar epimerase